MGRDEMMRRNEMMRRDEMSRRDGMMRRDDMSRRDEMMRKDEMMKRDDLLRSLMALDFMAVDLALFLDTNPDNAEALAEYNRIIRTADAVRTQFEAQFGPLCSFRSYADNGWRWIDNPWPWTSCANPELGKERC